MNRYITATAAAALVAVATLAAAQTLYKLVDKNGKVTYSESPPKDFPGQVIRIDIDPNRNTATLPKLKDSAPRETGGNAPAEKAADPAATARQRLEAAKKALADAQQNPSESDVTFIANKGGGTRPVPTDGYAAKLAGLEAEVKAAEEALRRAESR
ncbi:MAG TPA: DUF4124 domain-containing protein [Usitatibacter sp.]|nr:DUF4124 domain-containing protein [Usitatibacter sp.]